MTKFIQTPSPSKHCLLYCGDILEFRLESDEVLSGDVFLRTNIGNAQIMRGERCAKVDLSVNPEFQDWRNFPMRRIDDFTFSIRLLLAEPGHFEAKCFVVQKGSDRPSWPEGDNVHVNVEPASYCCANSIYCAFVRQFGSNKDRASSLLPEGITQDLLRKFDDDAFSLIPPSGTFRDLIRELDHIFNRLRCRILHLLPINPTPTVYGRMGRYGSPYAALDFTAVNPELAEFDRSATPLDQFIELVDAVHARGGKLFIDIAINHTGWAAKLHETHPEWLVRNSDGSIHSPGAWGVTWGDLTELDHSKPELWRYLADAFRTWCMRGVDGFRCDAGYMIPKPAWEYIVAKVRSEFPDTIFLLEGLGGDPAVTADLLNTANMNWAYSELFQNYSREQIEGYLNYAWGRSAGDGLMVHYAETHDNNRLASASPEYARLRTAISALASTDGAFGFTNGVEWFATEKIDVHEASALNWGSPKNQIDLIRKLNLLLAEHPAFHHGALLAFADCGAPDGILLCRTAPDGTEPLIIAANLNTTNSTRLTWSTGNVPFDEDTVVDILSGRRIGLLKESSSRRSLILSGAQIVCLAPLHSAVAEIVTSKISLTPEKMEADPFFIRVPALRMQEAAAMGMRILTELRGSPAACGEESESIAQALLDYHKEFFRHACGRDNPVCYTLWTWPRDHKRRVMVPPGHFLLIEAPCRFRAGIILNGKVFGISRSLLSSDGKTFFAFLPPVGTFSSHTEAELHITALKSEKPVRSVAPLLLLAPGDDRIPLRFSSREIAAGRARYLRGNGRGGLIFFPLAQNRLMSRYDALLLANLNKEYPVDRHILLRRFRLWAAGYASFKEFTPDFLSSFHIAGDMAGVWTYNIPEGNGSYVTVLVRLEIAENANTVRMTLLRKSRSLSGKNPAFAGRDHFKLLIRTDMEDRSYHGDTKASQGPEQFWHGKVRAAENGFLFCAAQDRFLDVRATKGVFRQEDEWHYNVHQEDEARRGLSSDTDLYSPGYFIVSLQENESVTLLVREDTSEPSAQEILNVPEVAEKEFAPAEKTTAEILEDSLAQFVVKRDKFKTVIAGYPWFLDWGRDTLITARGLLCSPRFRRDVKDIILAFASFAKDGTIPNMICGDNADNRDTSDAPLWLFTLCSDLCREEGSADFLSVKMERSGKTVLETLVGLAQGILHGTPNGIKADPDSMLVFSPAHFTWMDTNYPAGTPREGYPVEIQALWYAALRFLAQTDPDGAADWKEKAEKVRRSILRYFVLENTVSGMSYLSDCLHCSPGTPAANAEKDDHLRPNQLLAITLGAIPEEEQKLCRNILDACETLLIPGAIRTLGDMPVSCPLPVYGGGGRLLNDPYNPYWGNYAGDEDTRRKPAYHNGTAWTLPFPMFCEAFAMVYKSRGLLKARAILSSSAELFRHGTCVAQLPEILDGDFPHTPGGCQAQAWGISELYRVSHFLGSMETEYNDRSAT